MKPLLGLLSLIAGMVALFVFAAFKMPLVGCLIMVVVILINAYLHVTEPYVTPVCEECGRPIEEGADMYLEDGFETPVSPRKED